MLFSSNKCLGTCHNLWYTQWSELRNVRHCRGRSFRGRSEYGVSMGDWTTADGKKYWGWKVRRENYIPGDTNIPAEGAKNMKLARKGLGKKLVYKCAKWARGGTEWVPNPTVRHWMEWILILYDTLFQQYNSKLLPHYHYQCSGACKSLSCNIPQLVTSLQWLFLYYVTVLRQVCKILYFSGFPFS